ncbi:glycosyltransferase [Sorangium sp. So ce854]|uniref:glycosyltransferase n=1 Tax=Sorangium sp. So ce854 TaxID=3133322 RepID=UPI003F60B2D7
MARVMIWPDIYREQGHWLPCINLAKSLQDSGYAVEFMGIPDCQDITSGYGAPFRLILGSVYPDGFSFENKLEPLDQRWKPHHLLPICRGALDPVFLGPSAPDLLIGGYFTALESLLIHRKYGIPFIILTTYLRHPDDTPRLHAKTKLVYMPRAVSQKIIDAVSPEPGLDIDQFIEPLRDRLELIPCPRAFDFTDDDWNHDNHVKYVEPMIERQPLSGGSVRPDPTDIPEGKKLIFGTSGSQVQDYEFKARQFFINLIDMMSTQGMEEYHLVLAVGEKLLAQLSVEYGIDVNPLDNRLPKNVSLFSWVSQLDVLKRAEVVFMHGGLATIKESIWEEVPIVIVPHGKDQMDNALRIRRSGVGVVSEVADLTPQQLRSLFTAATTSTWVRQKLAKMKAVFQAEESKAPKPSIQLIQSVVAP